jgi:hypothetical protein
VDPDDLGEGIGIACLESRDQTPITVGVEGLISVGVEGL